MLRALVVEDESALHMLYGQVLKNAHFEVDKAWSGTEAINYLKDNGLPNLIVLDIRMPESTGYDVLAYLKDHPQADSVHVVIATATYNISQLVDLAPSIEIIYKPMVLPALRAIADRFSKA